MRELIIIPAFNEERNIGAVLTAIASDAPGFDVVVVNDGSADGTSAVARSFPGVRVIDLPENIGIGGAVQTGFLYARSRGYGLAVQVDGDGQHLPSEIAKIVAPVRAGEADAVIGSRFLDKARFPGSPFRRAGIAVFQLVNRALLGERITDSTSGFRAYNRRAIEVLAGSYPDDYPEPEAIYILRRKGLCVREVSVEMRTRAGGKSSITLGRSLYYMVKVNLAILVLILRKDA
jgi:glycosyltransferase involved in cell wall biosynthesis